MLKATSDASSSEPTPGNHQDEQQPELQAQNGGARLAHAVREPWLIDSTAPELATPQPGKTPQKRQPGLEIHANTAMRSRGGQHHSAFFANKVALRRPDKRRMLLNK